MAGATTVILAAGELLHVDLLALHGAHHLGLYLRTLHDRRTERQHAGLAYRQHFVEHHLAAGRQVAEVDVEHLALADAILPTAVNDDRVVVASARHAGGRRRGSTGRSRLGHGSYRCERTTGKSTDKDTNCRTETSLFSSLSA